MYRHFNVAVLLALCVLVTNGFAQTTSSLSGVAPKSQKERASAANPWLGGAQIGGNFLSKGEFQDQLIMSGRVQYDIISDDQFVLPIVTNFGADIGGQDADSIEVAANEITSSARGVSVGLQPYYSFREEGKVRPYLFGEMGFKSSSVKDTTGNEIKLAQVRLGLGGELHIAQSAVEGKPLTISAEWVYRLFERGEYGRVFGEERAFLSGAEFVSVFPISQRGVAVLVEVIAARRVRPSYRAGLIFLKS